MRHQRGIAWLSPTGISTMVTVLGLGAAGYFFLIPPLKNWYLGWKLNECRQEVGLNKDQIEQCKANLDALGTVVKAHEALPAAIETVRKAQTDAGAKAVTKAREAHRAEERTLKPSQGLTPQEANQWLDTRFPCPSC